MGMARYAAGEHVTFDAPIGGGAERLFKWFE
jgi:hypothetical protein